MFYPLPVARDHQPARFGFGLAGGASGSGAGAGSAATGSGVGSGAGSGEGSATGAVSIGISTTSALGFGFARDLRAGFAGFSSARASPDTSTAGSAAASAFGLRARGLRAGLAGFSSAVSAAFRRCFAYRFCFSWASVEASAGAASSSVFLGERRRVVRDFFGFRQPQLLEPSAAGVASATGASAGVHLRLLGLLRPSPATGSPFSTAILVFVAIFATATTTTTALFLGLIIGWCGVHDGWCCPLHPLHPSRTVRCCRL